MSAITDIYDYFTPIEDAIAAVFKAAEIDCFTALGEQPLGDGEAEGDVEDKRPRPRVEIVLHPGAAMGRLRAMAGKNTSSGHLREYARRSNLDFRLITKADIREHRAYVAHIQYLCDTLADAVNETRLLTNHRIAAIRMTGGEAGYRPQDGVIETVLTAEVDFSVQHYAFEAIET